MLDQFYNIPSGILKIGNMMYTQHINPLGTKTTTYPVPSIKEKKMGLSL